jgi:hypothetical protein
MATLLKTDGSRELDVNISTLRRMQEMVGGYIEFVYVEGNRILIVNEEGLLEGLDHNKQATEISGMPIVGDAILCGVNEIN